MIVYDLISDTVPSVKSSDLAARALDWMGEFKLGQLPIVDDGQYKGMITETDILDATSMEVPVGDIRFAGWESAYIYQGNHVFDAIEAMNKFKLEVLPVLDEENRFLGVITIRDLLLYLNRMFAVNEKGGILVIEIPQNSYVVSEIGRICESADATILSLYLSQQPDLSMQVTLKLNVEDLSRVVASFERFEYKIVRTYHKAAPLEDLQRNYEALLKYLDM
ncbi:MAG: CBS domain-containing protein [Bacteroidota bacterium]